jgi:hypothetical protein
MGTPAFTLASIATFLDVSAVVYKLCVVRPLFYNICDTFENCLCFIY